MQERGMKGRGEKEALRGRSMRCSPAVHLPNLKRRSTNDFPGGSSGLMEPERRGGAEKVEKLGFSTAMHIDGRDVVGKLAFNGGLHVVKIETNAENGF